MVGQYVPIGHLDLVFLTLIDWRNDEMAMEHEGVTELRIRLAQLESHTAVGEEIAEMRVAIARLDERSLAADKAITIAHTAQQEHAKQTNGLVDRLREQHAEFMVGTKQFVTVREHEELMKRLESMNDWRSSIGGREQMIRIIWIIGAFIVGLAIEWFNRNGVK